MKVLVATKETQGQRPGMDFCFCREGELVTPGTQCSTGRWDDGCGCRRAWCGLETLRTTTTAKVSEIDLTPYELTAIATASAQRAGWAEAAARKAGREVAAMLKQAEKFHEGDVVECGPRLALRQAAPREATPHTKGG